MTTEQPEIQISKNQFLSKLSKLDDLLGSSLYQDCKYLLLAEKRSKRAGNNTKLPMSTRAVNAAYKANMWAAETDRLAKKAYPEGTRCYYSWVEGGAGGEAVVNRIEEGYVHLQFSYPGADQTPWYFPVSDLDTHLQPLKEDKSQRKVKVKVEKAATAAATAASVSASAAACAKRKSHRVRTLSSRDECQETKEEETYPQVVTPPPKTPPTVVSLVEDESLSSPVLTREQARSLCGLVNTRFSQICDQFQNSADLLWRSALSQKAYNSCFADLTRMQRSKTEQQQLFTLRNQLYRAFQKQNTVGPSYVLVRDICLALSVLSGGSVNEKFTTAFQLFNHTPSGDAISLLGMRTYLEAVFKVSYLFTDYANDGNLSMDPMTDPETLADITSRQAFESLGLRTRDLINLDQFFSWRNGDTIFPNSQPVAVSTAETPSTRPLTRSQRARRQRMAKQTPVANPIITPTPHNTPNTTPPTTPPTTPTATPTSAPTTLRRSTRKKTTPPGFSYAEE